MRLQPIFDIAAICAQKGISNAVLCPGSRSAPITIAFARHTAIDCRTISDERSAAFIAMGIAQATNNPVALVCTSGSAAYNFSPAIAEAYYQQIPLVVLTADRPSEWIDQLDGQTIRQTNIYGNHVKQSYQLPSDFSHEDAVWYTNRILNEGINLANRFPKGPVHINIPLREPLYPAADEEISFSEKIRIIDEQKTERILPEETLDKLKNDFSSFHKVLIVAGQSRFEEQLAESLTTFSSRHHVPVVTDIISNLHGLPNSVTHADALLGQCKNDVKKVLKPELLITFGNSVISKNLKLFLREFKPQHHWHIQQDGNAADTFKSVTQVISLSPSKFFSQLSSISTKPSFETQKKENYFRLWEAEEHRTKRAVTHFFSTPQLTEFHLVAEVLKNLPPHTHLHLANSLAVRYANFIGLEESQNTIQVFANRGTSGIDGCTSTAVGSALSTRQPTVLITGDMAFLYDRNAFWHNYKIPNLRVVVLNNHGGAIFSVIDGPSQLPESDTYFVTDQQLNTNYVCREYDFDNLKLDNLRKLKNTLKDFFDFDGRTKVLEFESTAEKAKQVVEDFKKQIRNNYDV